MRYALFGLLLLAVACESPKSTTNMVRTNTAKDAPEIGIDDATRTVRATERMVVTYGELRQQGKTQQMQAMRDALGNAVDRNFDTFREVALEADTVILRNMATKCLPFAAGKETRTQARDTLLVLIRDRDITIVSNAVLGLGILLDKSTDLTPVITLLGHGIPQVRANAATALIGLFLVKDTPRPLTAQYHTAVERLSTLLHDQASIRSRRAAAWALANLRHPDVLPHLISALEDDDDQVQMGGLRGIEVLGDQRGLEPVLDYMDDAPGETLASWAKQALEAIALQAGFAKSRAEMTELGTSARTWRAWFRDRRMR